MSASFFNYLLWDMKRDQTFSDNLNCFLRTPTNTDNMLFLRMNYFDRQNYNDIKKTAAPKLVMTALSSHSDLYGGLKNFHSLVRKMLEAHSSIQAGHCFPVVWVFFPYSSFLWCFILDVLNYQGRTTALTPRQNNGWNQNDRKVHEVSGQEC